MMKFATDATRDHSRLPSSLLWSWMMVLFVTFHFQRNVDAHFFGIPSNIIARNTNTKCTTIHAQPSILSRTQPKNFDVTSGPDGLDTNPEDITGLLSLSLSSDSQPSSARKYWLSSPLQVRGGGADKDGRNTHSPRRHKHKKHKHKQSKKHTHSKHGGKKRSQSSRKHKKRHHVSGSQQTPDGDDDNDNDFELKDRAGSKIQQRSTPGRKASIKQASLKSSRGPKRRRPKQNSQPPVAFVGENSRHNQRLRPVASQTANHRRRNTKVKGVRKAPHSGGSKGGPHSIKRKTKRRRKTSSTATKATSANGPLQGDTRVVPSRSSSVASTPSVKKRTKRRTKRKTKGAKKHRKKGSGISSAGDDETNSGESSSISLGIPEVARVSSSSSSGTHSHHKKKKTRKRKKRKQKISSPLTTKTSSLTTVSPTATITRVHQTSFTTATTEELSVKNESSSTAAAPTISGKVIEEQSSVVTDTTITTFVTDRGITDQEESQLSSSATTPPEEKGVEADEETDGENDDDRDQNALTPTGTPESKEKESLTSGNTTAKEEGTTLQEPATSATQQLNQTTDQDSEDEEESDDEETEVAKPTKEPGIVPGSSISAPSVVGDKEKDSEDEEEDSEEDSGDEAAKDHEDKEDHKVQIEQQEDEDDENEKSPKDEESGDEKTMNDANHTGTKSGVATVESEEDTEEAEQEPTANATKTEHNDEEDTEDEDDMDVPIKIDGVDVTIHINRREEVSVHLDSNNSSDHTDKVISSANGNEEELDAVRTKVDEIVHSALDTSSAPTGGTEPHSAAAGDDGKDDKPVAESATNDEEATKSQIDTTAKDTNHDTDNADEDIDTDEDDDDDEGDAGKVDEQAAVAQKQANHNLGFNGGSFVEELPVDQKTDDGQSGISITVETQQGYKSTESFLDPPTKDSDMKVSVVTWNLAESSPSEEEANFIRKFRGSDIVLISGQECENIKPRRAEGHRSREFRRLMIKMLGKKYVPLGLHMLGGIQFGLFCKRSFLDNIEFVGIADVTCGIGNVFHNKGAIGAFVQVKATKDVKASDDAVKKAKSLKMLFVTSHMAAHVKNSEARDADFWRIVQELEAQAPPHFLPPNPAVTEDDNNGANNGGSGSYLIDSMDRVFFCGDLNYRINLPREEAEHTVEQMKKNPKEVGKLQERLIRHDQLLATMAERNAFTGLVEGKIAFLPTFKFDKGTGNYDTSHKQRIPAWTDRIVFKPDGTRIVEYDSIPDAVHSDHRPVFATFEVSTIGPALPIARKRKRRSRREAQRTEYDY